jgi:hypothetical protein
MISPASGIHRPSYNGAPATRTYLLYRVAAALLVAKFVLRVNVRGPAPHRSNARL